MNKPPPEKLLLIAQTRLDSTLTTLETRNRDELDFHEVSVWGIKAALLSAYELGWKAGPGKEQDEAE